MTGIPDIKDFFKENTRKEKSEEKAVENKNMVDYQVSVFVFTFHNYIYRKRKFANDKYFWNTYKILHRYIHYLSAFSKAVIVIPT